MLRHLHRVLAGSLGQVRVRLQGRNISLRAFVVDEVNELLVSG